MWVHENELGSSTQGCPSYSRPAGKLLDLATWRVYPSWMRQVFGWREEATDLQLGLRVSVSVSVRVRVREATDL